MLEDACFDVAELFQNVCCKQGEQIIATNEFVLNAVLRSPLLSTICRLMSGGKSDYFSSLAGGRNRTKETWSHVWHWQTIDARIGHARLIPYILGRGCGAKEGNGSKIQARQQAMKKPPYPQNISMPVVVTA